MSADRTIGRFGLARRLGIAPDSIPSAVRRGTVPPPDGRCGNRAAEFWKLETVLTWEAAGCPKIHPCLEKTR
jgi:hypothetical protein